MLWFHSTDSWCVCGLWQLPYGSVRVLYRVITEYWIRKKKRK